MADSFTPNLNLTKPEVTASNNTWGTKVNDDLTALDAIFKDDGTGTSVGMKVGSGKTLAVAGTLNVTGTVSGGIVTTLTGTQTLTNKTINGSDNTITNVSLTTGVTGTLPVANGGTGLTTTPTNGKLLIGNGTDFTLATLTAGTGISVTNGAGSITLAIDSGAYPAAAGSLTGSTLASNVTASSLTSLGTLTSLACGSAAFTGAVTNTRSGANANYTVTKDADGTAISFVRGVSEVGAISVTAFGTNFTSLSDYRLKENVEALSGAVNRLQHLKPYRFNWKTAPGGSKVDGFIAHEAAEVVPEAVNGDKDAVNADGSIKPQTIDASKLIPLLVAAVQELSARVAALEAR